MTEPSILCDDDLIARIASLTGVERTATASLIAHLAELEARNLHLANGFRSLFGYCRHVLHCSEHEAYNRMEAVHAARRFPVILGLLAEGRLHLTAVRLLAPHLRDEDHLALLGGAIHKSRREIVALLARWFPSPDVASSIRKLPTTPARAAATAAAMVDLAEAAAGSAAEVALQSQVAGGSATEPPGREAGDIRRCGLYGGARISAGRASACGGPTFGGPLPIAGHPRGGRARRSPVPAGPDASRDP